MKKAKLFTVLVVLLVVMMSCTTASFSGLTVTKDAGDYTELGNFETVVDVWEFLGTPGGVNLANVTADVMDAPVLEAIQAEIAALEGDAAVNVSIVQEADVVDMLITSVTGSILAPCQVRVTGTVVKY